MGHANNVEARRGICSHYLLARFNFFCNFQKFLIWCFSWNFYEILWTWIFSLIYLSYYISILYDLALMLLECLRRSKWIMNHLGEIEILSPNKFVNSKRFRIIFALIFRISFIYFRVDCSFRHYANYFIFMDFEILLLCMYLRSHEGFWRIFFKEFFQILDWFHKHDNKWI